MDWLILASHIYLVKYRGIYITINPKIDDTNLTTD